MIYNPKDGTVTKDPDTKFGYEEAEYIYRIMHMPLYLSKKAFPKPNSADDNEGLPYATYTAPEEG